MARELYPVSCPQCGEAQNVMPGGFDPDRAPFGPVTCMVCGNNFTRDDYLSGLAQATARRKPGSNVVPLRRN
ncbi:hypothetical protein RJ527_06740 [Thalassospiraceae bacterium LMO-SO8]|nr:hypothetical protein [Alphaproteobacteria bacterium LMO-S08]WND77433.1 hypothetical protein RJ527_06740 [Thalassospiraceae bacterium LMO-SO8]